MDWHKFAKINQNHGVKRIFLSQRNSFKIFKRLTKLINELIHKLINKVYDEN